MEEWRREAEVFERSYCIPRMSKIGYKNADTLFGWIFF
jgi:hypothetical protein